MVPIKKLVPKQKLKLVPMKIKYGTNVNKIWYFTIRKWYQ